ncbi:MAG: hypothetical protein IAX22_01755 [Candidatus Bathyarchaeota archaeon]|nr:hypothetical protein [Candidatus Bathyarchaeota archaeon]
MPQTKTKRDVTLYAIAAWMIINILLMVLLIVNGDVADLNNWIEIALWAISIPALLSTKKWGIAFTLFTLIYTLSTSMGILIYFQIWLNGLRVLINLPIITYLFHSVFQTKFK